MGYSSYIGSRYLRSRGKRSSISAITLIAIFGVALGVMALSVVMAISSGFEEEFTRKVLGVNAHVLVMKYGFDFTEYRDVVDQARKEPGVRGAAPFVIQEMMISREDRTSGVLLKGVDPEHIHEVLDLPQHIIAGSLDGLRIPGASPPKIGAPPPASDATDPAKLPGIILGKTLAENLAAEIGSVVQVTTPLIGLDVLGWSPSDTTPKSRAYRVVGVFYAGFLEYDTKLAYVDYFEAQRFFNHGDSVTGVEVTLHDIEQGKEYAAKFETMFGTGPYHTVDWEMLNAPLFTALKMQKVVLAVVLAVIVGVAAFNIIATLVMMVFDRRREIAILKSMGATHRGILAIFVHVGTAVGLYGIGIGLGIGYLACLLLYHVGWPLDPDVYLIDHLPVRLNYIDFALTAGVAFCICLVSTVFPSLRASRMHPVDGLRQD